MRNPRTTTQCSAYSWQLEKAPVLCVQLLSHVPLLQPQGHQPIRLPCPWDFPGKKARVGCHFLFQGIFLTQGSNWRLLHWQAGSLPLNHLGIPRETPYTATKTQCSQKNKYIQTREVGGGIGMGKTCKLKDVSFQCMTKFTTKKKNK